MDKEPRVYGRRWVVLGLFMLVNLAMQALWISYAPVTGPAARLFGVSDLAIGFLSMVFMIAFIPLSIPASWAIDRFGFKVAVGLGSAVMGAFGLLRGLSGEAYWAVLACTIGIAAAQPFLLNAWTKVPALWFARGERATAVGLVTLANIVGTALGMVLTPPLMDAIGLPATQLWYGAAAAASAALFIGFTKERPPTPPGDPGEGERALMLEGIKHALSVKSFRLYLGVSFIGFCIFNGVTTWIEGIIRGRGFTPTDAGLLGALMLGGGVLGAVAVPLLSDRTGRRKPFMAACLALTLPFLAGLAFASSAWLLYGSAFLMGFFLVSINPIGMQYASEIARPTPEGTSNGLIQLCGQASAVFVYIMEAMKTADGSFTPSLVLSMVLLVLGVILILFMKEARLPGKGPR